MVSAYFNRYTAICETCVSYMDMKLKKTPYAHDLCPCCHETSGGSSLSLCSECLEEIQQDGYAESRWGSWHLDETTGKIVCIRLDF